MKPVDVMRPQRRASLKLALCLSLVPFAASLTPVAAYPFNMFGGPSAYDERVAPPRPSADPVRPRKSKFRKADKPSRIETVPPGQLQLVISIAKQRVTLFSDTVRVGEAPVSTGVAGHPTPMGVFSVISKARYHASNIYSGAPMPYMQRITWSGIALHQGPLPGFPASHGCIRLPEAFAVKLFGLTKLGARVVITRDEAAPVAVESARLFQPKAIEPVPGTAPMAKSDGPEATGATTELAANPIKPLELLKLADGKPARPKLPVQVFVSRKSGKLYVRQGFEPVFETPVTIADPDKPWGTHVFTVEAIRDNKASWMALTVPSGFAAAPDRYGRNRMSAREREKLEKRAADLAHAPTAVEALTRFDMPQDAVERIVPMLAAGASLVVSDNPLSDETGSETGFIVTTN